MEIIIHSTSEIQEAAKTFLAYFKNSSVIAFYGEMGAGKTTFIKALCKELSCIDIINSPTFAIINEYATQQSERIYHFDFYRVEEQIEAVNMGVEDYFYSGNWCFIEWPQVVDALLPEDTVRIQIVEQENKQRKIKKY